MGMLKIYVFRKICERCLLFSLVFLASCSRKEETYLFHHAHPQKEFVKKDFFLTSSNKIFERDFVIILDTSQSMEDIVEIILENILTFFDNIYKRGRIDWRLGITSSIGYIENVMDQKEFSYMTPFIIGAINEETKRPRDEFLYYDRTSPIPLLESKAQSWKKDYIHNADRQSSPLTKAHLLKEFIFFNLERFLDHYTSFRRKDVPLEVIMVTDAEEQSAKSTNHTLSTLNKNFGYRIYDPHRYKPQYFLKLLQEKGRVRFHGILGFKEFEGCSLREEKYRL